MAKLASEPELCAKMGIAARQRVASDFVMSKRAQILQQLYYSALCHYQ